MSQQDARRLLKKWQPLLGLQGWKITLNCRQIAHKGDCEARPEYKEAIIRLDTRKIPAEELEAYVVHELLHCHIWRLADVAEHLAKTPTEARAVEDAEESLTTEIERLILGLVRAP